MCASFLSIRVTASYAILALIEEIYSVFFVHLSYSCLTLVSRTARRRMTWTSDFKFFSPIALVLFTLTSHGENATYYES